MQKLSASALCHLQHIECCFSVYSGAGCIARRTSQNTRAAPLLRQDKEPGRGISGARARPNSNILGLTHSAPQCYRHSKSTSPINIPSLRQIPETSTGYERFYERKTKTVRLLPSPPHQHYRCCHHGRARSHLPQGLLACGLPQNMS
jgi:hypothetical protein